MKTNLRFQSRFLAFLMAVLIFSTPFTALAQQNSVEAQAKIAAERDAETDTNKLLWTGVGCAVPFGMYLGAAVGTFAFPDDGIISNAGICIGLTLGCLVPLAVVYAHQLAPSPERLLGKSPEYVDFYTSTYKTKIRLLRTKWAVTGLAINVGGLVLFSAALEVD